MTKFKKELTELINRHSMENNSDTPDFILAHFMSECLSVFDTTVSMRNNWYNSDEKPITNQAAIISSPEENSTQPYTTTVTGEDGSYAVLMKWFAHIDKYEVERASPCFKKFESAEAHAKQSAEDLGIGYRLEVAT